MIALSKEIQQAVQESEDKLVRLVDPETNVEYVVVPAETYEQMRNGVYYDDSPLTEEERRAHIPQGTGDAHIRGPLTEEERRALLIQAGLRAGWDDPEMDIYNDLDLRRRNF